MIVSFLDKKLGEGTHVYLQQTHHSAHKMAAGYSKARDYTAKDCGNKPDIKLIIKLNVLSCRTGKSVP